jgi:hypothetical protein
VAGSGITARMGAGGVSAGVDNGSFGLVLNDNGTYVLEASGGFHLSGGDFAGVSAEMAVLRLNTTGAAKTATTLQVGGYTHAISAMSALSDPVIRVTGLQARIGDRIGISGDFAFERDGVTADLQVLASNASASLRAGDVRAGVSDADVALVISNRGQDSGVWLEASGSADMALDDAVQVSADSAAVRWNSTGVDATGRQIQVAGAGHTFGSLAAGLRQVEVSGADVVVGDFFRVSGDFAFVSDRATVKLAADTDGTAVNEAQVGLSVDLLTLGGAGLDARIGVAGGPELVLGGVSFGMALMSAQNDASRRWTSVQAQASQVSLSGLAGITVSGQSLAFALNQAESVGDAVVDYGTGRTVLAVSTGVSSSLALSMDGARGELLQASGQVSLDLFGFFRAAGSFAFERGAQSVTLADGSVVDADDGGRPGRHGLCRHGRRHRHRAGPEPDRGRFRARAGQRPQRHIAPLGEPGSAGRQRCPDRGGRPDAERG